MEPLPLAQAHSGWSDQPPLGQSYQGADAQQQGAQSQLGWDAQQQAATQGSQQAATSSLGWDPQQAFAGGGGQQMPSDGFPPAQTYGSGQIQGDGAQLSGDGVASPSDALPQSGSRGALLSRVTGHASSGMVRASSGIAMASSGVSRARSMATAKRAPAPAHHAPAQRSLAWRANMLTWTEFPLNVSLHLGDWVSRGYFAIMLVLLWYKGIVFVYETGIMIEELFLMLCFLVLQRVRVAVGNRGHKTRSFKLLVIFMFLGVAVAYVIGYHLSLQLYVLRADVVLCGIALSVLILEGLMGFLYGVAIADALVPRIVLGIGFLLLLTMASVNLGFHLNIDAANFYGAPL